MPARARAHIYGELAETVVADEGGGGAPLRQSSRCPFSELLLPVAAAGGDLDGAIREALRPSELEGFVGRRGGAQGAHTRRWRCSRCPSCFASSCNA